MSNAPDAAAGQQDFIKGWPNAELLERPELQQALTASYTSAIQNLGAAALNYGTKADGAFMKGHPAFLGALSEFLGDQYGKEVPTNTLMSTGGASMATDIACRVHAAHGDIAVTEAPTYYLAHNMFRERGLELREVPIQPDGIDIEALEALLQAEGERIKLLYTIPVHHNPTGITMSNAKRERLVALARQYDFKILADEAYQLLTFSPPAEPVLPLHYHDDPEDPRVMSLGTFSKTIGPGVKVGWVQAHPALIKPLADIGFIDSGNNPVIFTSCGLAEFVRNGLKQHIAFCCEQLGKKKDTLVRELEAAGLEPYNPNGGYFVWVKSKGKMTGRSGKGMSLNPPDAYAEYMRLCFAWLSEEDIVKGVAYLKQ